MRCLEPGWMMRPPFSGGTFDKRSAWMWILSAADPQAGRLHISIRDLAIVLDWSKDKTHRFLNELINYGYIATDTATGITLITICNYERLLANPWINETERATPHKKVSRRKSARSLPDDFAISDDMRNWANEKAIGVDIEIKTERFCAYWRARDGRFARWDQAWKNWVLKSNEFNHRKRPARGTAAATDERRTALTLAVTSHRQAAAE